MEGSTRIINGVQKKEEEKEGVHSFFRPRVANLGVLFSIIVVFFTMDGSNPITGDPSK